MLRRLLPLSGIVFVVLVGVAFAALGGNTPGGGSSAERVTSFYLAHNGREKAAVYVLAIAVGFLALFAAAAWRQAPPGIWRLLFVTGAAIAAAGFLAAGMLHFALVEGVHNHVSPAAAQALNELDAYDYLPFSIGIGIMLVGAAGLGIPGRGFERVLGWTALVLGIGAFTPAGFFTFLAAGVWIVAASIALTLQDDRERALGSALVAPGTVTA
jgi:hypothetical protein